MAFLLLDLLLTTAIVLFSLKLFHQAHPPPASQDEQSRVPLEAIAGFATSSVRPSGPAETTTPLEQSLRRICRSAGYGNIDEFTNGAKLAYELIVAAFASGNLSEHGHLLSPDVRAAFEAAIAERKARGEMLSTTFIGFRSVELVDAGLAEGMAWIDVRFVSGMVSVTRDRDGKVIVGHPERVIELAELWTFERELRSSAPEWILVATEAGA